jgi:hypothetical protein
VGRRSVVEATALKVVGNIAGAQGGEEGGDATTLKVVAE